MNGDYRGYRGKALETLKAYDAQVWSDVQVRTDKGAFTGIILPRSETADAHHIVSSCEAGTMSGSTQRAYERSRSRAAKKRTTRSRKGIPPRPKETRVKLFVRAGPLQAVWTIGQGPSFLHSLRENSTGRCLSSRTFANLETEKLYGVFSENMGPEQWIGTAQAIGREIEKALREL